MTAVDQGLDMSVFLLAHAAMRQEFGLLACAAHRSADRGNADLVEDQIALVLGVLHEHHTGEDELIWPMLRERAPHACAELDALEAEHERIDPLLAAAGDRSVPLPARADALEALHLLVNEHLDHEERVAVPLIRAHYTAEEWAGLEAEVRARPHRGRLPVVIGWLASTDTPDLQARAFAGSPVILRLLFRFVWWPAYCRRARRLYGQSAPAAVRR